MTELPNLRLHVGRLATEARILEAARGLIGLTLGELGEAIYGLEGRERVQSKAAAADIVERDYFGMATNSSPDPDFMPAGIELKVTPLKTDATGLARPKERLVLSMVDYRDAHTAKTWSDVPALRKKLNKVLIVWYLYSPTIPRPDWPIVAHTLWTPTKPQQARMNKDLAIIQNEIRNKRHPSERLTEFLATCPKHGGGFLKDTPHLSPRSAVVAPDAHPFMEHAEKRGWCIKQNTGALEILAEATGLPIETKNRTRGVSTQALLAQAAKARTINRVVP